MKNDHECCAYSKANPYTAPKPPMVRRLRLIILGHGATLLPVCLRAKRKWHRAAVAGSVTPAGLAGGVILKVEKLTECGMTGYRMERMILL
jgi:hypothetical protein